MLEAIDQTLITQDHNWRDIIMALNSVPKPFNEYKKVALIKYMQYLTSRQEIVQTLYATRLVQRFGVEENEAAGGPAGAEDPKLKETLIFDLAAFASPPEQPEAFTRIPKGETIEIALEPNQTVDLLLAKCRCRISLSGNLTFADDQGNDSVLPKGKCVVGRDYNSDIVIDSSARDVSRKHLIVETDGQRRVRLTDISSHGTSVPPQFLERTG